MGLLNFLFSKKESRALSMNISIGAVSPNGTDLSAYKSSPCSYTYSQNLISYDEIINDHHQDKRVLIHYLSTLIDNPLYLRPRDVLVDTAELNEATNIMLSLGWMNYDDRQLLYDNYKVDELKEILQNKNLPVKGNKSDLVLMLMSTDNYKDFIRKPLNISEKILTKECKLIIQERIDDYWKAIRTARQFATNFNFSKIVDVFNAFDSKWGFVDLINKKYCSIFANYYVPDSRFQYIVNYQLKYKNRHPLFKDDIKPYIIIGLINGTHRPYNICADYLKDYNIKYSNSDYERWISNYIDTLMEESRDATIDDILSNKNSSIK